MTTWREHSRGVLTRIQENAIADLGEPATWTDKEKKQFLQRLSEGYPFAQRRGWAYAAWLAERADVLVELGLAKAKPGKQGKTRKPGLKEDAVVPGQIPLF